MEKHMIVPVLLSLVLAPGCALSAQATNTSVQQSQTPQTPPVSTVGQPPSQPGLAVPGPEGDSVSGQSPSATPVNPNSYRIGLQDEVKITVFNEPDLTNMYRVDADGSISFPFIGHVAAAGLTPADLQQRLTTMLAAGYIR